MLHGFDWSKWTSGKPAEKLALIPGGQQHILEQDDGKPRFVQIVKGHPKAESPTQEMLRDGPFVAIVLLWVALVMLVVYQLRPS